VLSAEQLATPTAMLSVHSDLGKKKNQNKTVLRF